MRRTADERRLLVVEDDAQLCNQLVRSLSQRGFEADGVTNYDDALTFAADRSPGFAVVDLRLSKDNGLDVVRDLLRVNPATQVVVLTGYGSIATAVRCIRLGAVDYLTKPASADEIVAALLRGRAAEALDEAETAPPSLAQAEWEHIQRVLSDCDGNITHAAERLGLHRRSLQRKLARPPGN